MQVGGPLGAYFPPEKFDTIFDYESFTDADGLIGHAGIVVFDDTVDMLKQARFAFEFCALESCGKCTPCRIGAVRGVEVIDRIAAGKADGENVDAQIELVTDLLRNHEVRIALRTGRFHPVSRGERADPFPGGLPSPHLCGRGGVTGP